MSVLDFARQSGQLSEQNVVETAEPAQQIVLVRFEEDEPLRIDPILSDFWGDSEDLEELQREMSIAGTDRFTIDVARITNEPGKPVILDGHRTYHAWKQLRQQGVALEMPRVVEHEFPCMDDVYTCAVKKQIQRRNLDCAEMARAVIKLCNVLYGQSVGSLSVGRPPSSTRSDIRTPKQVAAEFGVSEYAVNIVSKAEKYPEIYETLFHPDPEKRIPLRIAATRIKAYKRDAEVTKRRQIAKKRSAEAATRRDTCHDGAATANGIYTGNFSELMKSIEPNSVSLIVTSPPYPIPTMVYDCYQYNGYKNYLDTLIRPLFAQAKRVLRSGGRIVVNFDSGNGNTFDLDGGVPPVRLPVVKHFSMIAEDENGLLLYDHKNWYKQNCSDFISRGVNGGCRSPRGNFNNEFIYVWAKDSDVLEQESEHRSDIGDEYNQFVLSDWYVPPKKRASSESEDFHPCPFPEEIAYRAIKLYCYPGDIVLDPFNGSGTTTFVAKALGRQYIGLDNSPHYCESAIRRLNALEGKTPQEMIAMITRFKPDPAERADGRGPAKRKKTGGAR